MSRLVSGVPTRITRNPEVRMFRPQVDGKRATRRTVANGLRLSTNRIGSVNDERVDEDRRAKACQAKRCGRDAGH
jgi:hypothetical protein